MRSRILTLTLPILAALALPCGAAAQETGTACTRSPVVCAYRRTLDQLAAAKQASPQTEKTRGDVANRLRDLMEPGQAADLFVSALAGDIPTQSFLFNGFVDAWERARVDKQTGAPPKGSGSTDLASRPSTPELLGLAVQLGALTETVNGSTATFNANAEGAYRAIVGKPVVCLACADTFWRKLSFSASFDLGKEGTQQVATAGAATPATPAVAMVELPQSSRQLSSATARYDIYNPLDPRSADFKKAWGVAYQKHQGEIESEARRLIEVVAAIVKPLDKDKRINELVASASARKELEEAAAGSADQLDKAFEKYFATLVSLAREDIPNLDQKITAAIAAFASYAQLNYDAVQEARANHQVTAQYTYNRPQNQPETHEVKLIVGLNPQGAGGALFTLNLAGSIYGGSIPAGARYGRLRDVQLAAQFDRPLGSLMTHPATLTLAGYVQYQRDPSVLDIGQGNLAPGTGIVLPQNAQVLLGTKGVLAVGQAKITFNTKSGVNIPIAISWANKTELLNAHDVRGHVGITYDFNSISEVFGGQSGGR